MKRDKPAKAARTKRAVSKPATRDRRGEVAPTPPKLVQPSGRWTVVQFPEGVPVEDITGLVIEAVMAAKAQRLGRQKWVALLGEFFMGEGRPVLLVSPDVPAQVVRSLDEFRELFGPVKVRKATRSSLAFRGRELVWLQDDFEQGYPTPSAGT